MSKLGAEKASVQNTLIQYACEIGWEYINPDDALLLRGGNTGFIFKDLFVDQMCRLNPGFMDNIMAEELLGRLKRIPSSIEGNLEEWEYLRGLKTVFVPSEKRERNATLIDTENISNNVFHVTDEFAFTNGATPGNRYDVAFLINGVPVFFVETKASHKLEGVAEALDQVRRYHRETPEMMALFQVYAMTHIIQFYYSATWNHSTKFLYNWKSELGTTSTYEELVKTYFDREKIIKVLTEYILFTRQDDELSKVILRPHQMRAVTKIVERAEEGKLTRGLIWHTQGSGKTFTMIVVAERILLNPTLENPTVIMLVDRNELETQLFGNLSAVGFKHVHVTESKEDLRGLLKDDTRGLIVTMIHKFEGMPKDINTRKNIFVLVDEAHRTTGGDLGNYLMGSLPNATYIGFTGTPIDRTSYGKGTFVVFGRDDPPKGYLDKYGIAESIEDGATVKLHYTLAKNDLLPDKEVLEKEFLCLAEAEGVSDIETLNKVLEKAVNLRNMLKNKGRMEDLAKYVVDHYQKYVEPMGYKAFLVAVDREACALYKKELDKLLPEDYSKVVYSPAQNDPDTMREYYLSDTTEKQIRKDFRKPDKLPKILIVTEKLLTGYDAPILYCMYLDKPMRDHVLLQAIARVNRPYEDDDGRKKPCGFILDFVGIFDKLEKALAFDSSDIADVVKDIQVLKERFVNLIDTARSDHLVIITGKTRDKAVEALLQHFMDEEIRHGFYGFYKEISDIYEIVSPDAFLRDYIEEYDTLSRMYRILREAYEGGVLIDREFTRKTARLVQEHTHTGPIESSLEIYEIDEDTLQKIEESKASDTEKIFNLLRSIGVAVTRDIRDNPYLISIAEKAERISQLYKEQQKNTQEALDELKRLIQEMNAAKKERFERKMAPDVFSIYWIMKDAGIPDSEDHAKAMEGVLKKYPHWRTLEDHERNIKNTLNPLLVKSKIEVKKAVELASKIIKILKGSVN